MVDIPIVVTRAGLQPTPPATLRQMLLDLVAATNPGYTANLPGSLVEDIASTDVGALSLIDGARVETVNSLTPYGANTFLLNQLGQVYGVQIGEESNTSVFVTFSAAGSPGFVIAEGFTVSDGTHQYTVKDGGILDLDGNASLFCLATETGSWAIPANTVNALVTSVPSTVVLTANNPEPGTPGEGEETEESYRSRVLRAGLAASQGMATFLKTLLSEVSGVQDRLVSVVQATDGWIILVGGGDPYQVAYAIYTALFDVSSLQGSELLVTGITKANPAVVTTDLNHDYVTGQVINISGVVGMVAVNNIPLTVTVVDEKRLSLDGVNSTGYPNYVSGGVVTPSLRNVSVSIQDYPNTYIIPFVNPPQQSVAMTVTWNTSATNFVSSAAVAQLGVVALAAYVNAISVGQPMNLFELQTTFQAAVASVLPPALLTRMVFAVSINGVGTAPEAGTGIIAGDPQSYFLTAADGSDITIVQG